MCPVFPVRAGRNAASIELAADFSLRQYYWRNFESCPAHWQSEQTWFDFGKNVHTLNILKCPCFMSMSVSVSMPVFVALSMSLSMSPVAIPIAY